MMRRRLLNALVRMLTAWVLLTVQGVCDTAHFAACAFVPAPHAIACAAPAPTPENREARHAALCHCRMCHGPKHCCCDTATSEAEGAAFRAVCDTPDDKSLPGVVGPIRALPPAPVTAAFCQLTALPLLPVRTPDSYRPRRPEPVTPPPSV